MPVQTSFLETPESPGELIFSLTVPGRLPSWNEILGMEHWARYKFKQGLATAFLCALRQSANDCSMKTTSAKSTTLIYADTLERYLAIAQQRRALKSASKKRSRGLPRKSELKSSDLGKVPF